MAAEFRRIQFVVSGPFLLLLLLATGFMTAGFWLYIHRPPPPKPQSPPYYVNRTLTAVRPCYQCIGPDGKLKASPEWRFGKTVEIPPGEQWWHPCNTRWHLGREEGSAEPQPGRAPALTFDGISRFPYDTCTTTLCGDLLHRVTSGRVY